MAWIDLLLHEYGRSSRSRAYLTALDVKVDRLKTQIDADRGLNVFSHDDQPLLDAGSAATPLPHETIADYWELSPEAHAAVTSPQAKSIYARNSGREGTATLAAAAFCWAQPASIHHQDPQLLRYVLNGIRFHTRSIRQDGGMGNAGLNGMVWAHGWDVEGIIYALTLCREGLGDKEIAIAKTHLTRSANFLASLPQKVKGGIGTVGNQRCVWLLGMHLYAELLDRPELSAIAEPYWQDVLPRILDDTGLVIEQHGPCTHYSITGFVYAWINVLLRGGDQHNERLLKCMQWFKERYTDSSYPFPGPSTRKYIERPAYTLVDLWPAAEHMASLDPSLREFVDRIASRCAELTCPPGHAAHQDHHLLAGSHLSSVLMWAAIMADKAPAETAPVVSARVPAKSSEKTSPADAAQKVERVTSMYMRSTQHGRMPLPYVYIRRNYQTVFSYADFLPFAGLQTWAWGSEPPIIHPTPMYPSTTTAMGIDTARSGASHNWGLFGAGAMALDVQEHTPDAANELWVFLARYHTMWRVLCLSDDAAVLIEIGDESPRTNRWTLNRVEPAAPIIESGRVRFEGRTGCLHTTLKALPTLETSAVDDEWAKNVQQLVYESGVGVSAFAFGTEAFRFQPYVEDKHTLGFSDGSGSYQIKLDPRLFGPNHGHLRLDPYQLTRGINVSRV